MHVLIQTLALVFRVLRVVVRGPKQERVVSVVEHGAMEDRANATGVVAVVEEAGANQVVLAVVILS